MVPSGARLPTIASPRERVPYSPEPTNQPIHPGHGLVFVTSGGEIRYPPNSADTGLEPGKQLWRCTCTVGPTMGDEDDRPTRCRGCGTPLAGTDTVEVTVSREERTRTTVICDDCATVDCVNCGHAVSIAASLSDRSNIWEHHERYQCVKCGESVPGRDIVELRHENDAGYRKLVCSECLQDVPIPWNIRVIRDFPGE